MASEIATLFDVAEKMVHEYCRAATLVGRTPSGGEVTIKGLERQPDSRRRWTGSARAICSHQARAAISSAKLNGMDMDIIHPFISDASLPAGLRACLACGASAESPIHETTVTLASAQSHISAAILAEREACARLADCFARGNGPGEIAEAATVTASRIAAGIRARRSL